MSARKKTDSESLNFEENVAELERIVAQLEKGDLPLDKSIAVFEKGMAISEQCRKQLEDAETRVEMLLSKGGKVDAEPFDTDESGKDESAEELPF
jgi:exodeoxyribonuclease VII small subunit